MLGISLGTGRKKWEGWDQGSLPLCCLSMHFWKDSGLHPHLPLGCSHPGLALHPCVSTPAPEPPLETPQTDLGQPLLILGFIQEDAFSKSGRRQEDAHRLWPLCVYFQSPHSR